MSTRDVKENFIKFENSITPTFLYMYKDCDSPLLAQTISSPTQQGEESVMLLHSDPSNFCMRIK